MSKTKKGFKRFVSIVTCLVMVFALLPVMTVTGSSGNTFATYTEAWDFIIDELGLVASVANVTIAGTEDGILVSGRAGWMEGINFSSPQISAFMGAGPGGGVDTLAETHQFRVTMSSAGSSIGNGWQLSPWTGRELGPVTAGANNYGVGTIGVENNDDFTVTMIEIATSPGWASHLLTDVFEIMNITVTGDTGGDVTPPTGTLVFSPDFTGASTGGDRNGEYVGNFGIQLNNMSQSTMEVSGSELHIIPNTGQMYQAINIQTGGGLYAGGTDFWASSGFKPTAGLEYRVEFDAYASATSGNRQLRIRGNATAGGTWANFTLTDSVATFNTFTFTQAVGGGNMQIDTGNTASGYVAISNLKIYEIGGTAYVPTEPDDEDCISRRLSSWNPNFSGAQLQGAGAYVGNFGIQLLDTTNANMQVVGSALHITATDGGWKDVRIQTGTAAGGSNYYHSAGFNAVTNSWYSVNMNLSVSAGPGQVRFSGSGASASNPDNQRVVTTTPTDFVHEYKQTTGNLTFDTGSTPTNEALIVHSLSILELCPGCKEHPCATYGEPPPPTGGGGGTTAPPATETVEVAGIGGDENENISATMDTGTGAVTIEMDEDAKQSLIDGALDKATAGETPTVTFDLSAIDGAASLTLPAGTVELFNDAGVALLIVLPDAEVLLDVDALEELAESGLSGPVTVVATEIEADELAGMQGAYADYYDGGLVISIDVFIGNTKVNVPITVGIPYTLKAGEDPKGVRVWYLGEDGTMTCMKGVYNAATGMITFTIGHQSYFLVAYDPVSLWTNIFRDVRDNAWYYDAVAYVNHHGLFSGYEGGLFGPNDPMTRAMFVTVLWNLEGRPVLNVPMVFSDVPAGEWYTEAVRWASFNNVVLGSDGKFNPTGLITRQEMVLMLSNFAAFKQVEVPVNRSIPSFNDFSQISGWALDAARAFVRAGVINGSNNAFMPVRNASRAEVATVFKNFMQFVGFPGAFKYDESGEAIIPEKGEIDYDMVRDCLDELELGDLGGQPSTAYLVDAGAALEVTDDNPNGGKSLLVTPRGTEDWRGLDLKQGAFGFEPGVTYRVEISGRIAAGGLRLTYRKNEAAGYSESPLPMTGTSSGGTFSYTTDLVFNAGHFENVGAIMRFNPTAPGTAFYVDKLTVVSIAG